VTVTTTTTRRRDERREDHHCENRRVGGGIHDGTTVNLKTSPNSGEDQADLAARDHAEAHDATAGAAFEHSQPAGLLSQDRCESDRAAQCEH